MAIIVTGVADFFRSNFVLDWFNTSDEAVTNLKFLPQKAEFSL